MALWAPLDQLKNQNTLSNSFNRREIRSLRGKAYLITEYCSGYPAERLIGKKEFGKEPLFIVNLLKALFDNQLVHGDLKSQNFLIEDDSACIIDLDSTLKYGKLRTIESTLERKSRGFLKIGKIIRSYETPFFII